MLIMARLAKGAESSISMAFLMMCAEKIRSKPSGGGTGK
jgi:hypothetical protein